MSTVTCARSPRHRNVRVCTCAGHQKFVHWEYILLQFKGSLSLILTSINKINDLSKKNPYNKVIIEYIGENSDGQRIDNYLIKYFKYVPKSHLYQLLRSGQVRVNSKRINASYRLQHNDKLRIPPVRTSERKSTTPNKTIAKSRFTPIKIVFQDEGLLVIDKPAGMAVHGGSGVSFGVIEQLRAQYPDWKYLELVHRLDRETSGVLLLAKKRKVLVGLHQQIRAGTVEKRYYALVKGRWHNHKQNVQLLLDKYLTASGERRVAVITDPQSDKKGIHSHTIFTLQKSWQNFSLLDAELKTGRTHQIRVHLAHLGFPIAGDDKYGDFTLNKQLAKSTQQTRLPRMFLHARKINIIHPLTMEPLSLEAPLTNDLQTFMDGLGSPNKIQ